MPEIEIETADATSAVFFGYGVKPPWDSIVNRTNSVYSIINGHIFCAEQNIAVFIPNA